MKKDDDHRDRWDFNYGFDPLHVFSFLLIGYVLFPLLMLGIARAIGLYLSYYPCGLWNC